MTTRAVVRRGLLSVAMLTVLSACGGSAGGSAAAPGQSASPQGTPGVDAVGTQYDSAHVYLSAGSIDKFVAAWLAAFGGKATAASVVDVTPTASRTKNRLVLSSVGTLSVFEFQTPVPYPFGVERTGWLMRDFDHGVADAQAAGAHLLVAPFPDPIGRDAIIQFPGGINAQLYWHTTAPSYAPLASTPENRLYLSADAVDEFTHSYLAFTGGKITSDEPSVDGAELNLPGTAYRRIRISSLFGDTGIAVTDGHLPYPFGRETTGYTVTDLAGTLQKATAAGATTLFGPYNGTDRISAILEFPGGYIAEMHQVR